MVPYRSVAPEGPWAPVRSAWHESGRVVVYGAADAWASTGPEGLPAADLARHAALHTPAARRTHLASRLLARRTLGVLLGVPWREVRITRTSLGAPVLPDLPGIRIGISHTRQLVTVGVSRCGPLGVDAERACRAVRPELAGRICTPAELAAVAALEEHERSENLLRLWTLKEAYVKALGTGLRVPVRGFGFAGFDGPHPDGPGGWSFTTRAVRIGPDRAPYLVSAAAAVSAGAP
ncbi:4'-phosphopantetheinyl transferase superfamily protein [Streptomyces sp. NPDC047072]|uniref:4'-phosphopantetheinyl transferase family protein n=1 Tax=Streptomyces sp. NPDC047072 TaxID=3154809 RepID=UPI0033FB87C9